MATHSKPKKLDAEGLWNYALRALGTRAHSVNELRQKLSRRATTPDAVSDAMHKLNEYGLTDDQKYAEALASSRLQNQGFGRFRVQNELCAKRVAKTTVETALNHAYSGVEENELIKNFLTRKYRGKDLRTLLADPKQLASAYRRLRLAGFSSSGSLSVLKQFSSGIEEWNAPAEDDSL